MMLVQLPLSRLLLCRCLALLRCVSDPWIAWEPSLLPPASALPSLAAPPTLSNTRLMLLAVCSVQPVHIEHPDIGAIEAAGRPQAP